MHGLSRFVGQLGSRNFYPQSKHTLVSTAGQGIPLEEERSILLSQESSSVVQFQNTPYPETRL